MKFHCDGDFASLEVFGNQNPDFDLVISDLFVVCLVDMKSVEARFWCRVIVGGHG